MKMGDTKFSDSLELMTFLANLVGSEHIERFIPFADPQNERELRPASSRAAVPCRALAERRAAAPLRPLRTATRRAARRARRMPPRGTREMPAFVAAKGRARPTDGGPRAPPGAPDATTGTREMPEFVGIKRQAPPPVGTAHVARTERKPSAQNPCREPPPNNLVNSPRPRSTRRPNRAKLPHARRAPRDGSPSDAAREQVIADAARLVQWGRKWYELAELIARMADRPPLPEVRRIIKDNKTAIEKKAGRS